MKRKVTIQRLAKSVIIDCEGNFYVTDKDGKRTPRTILTKDINSGSDRLLEKLYPGI